MSLGSCEKSGSVPVIVVDTKRWTPYPAPLLLPLNLKERVPLRGEY